MKPGKKRILIIGGAGFLGVNLTIRLLAEPQNEVTLLDSLDPLFHSHLGPLESVMSKIRFIHGDIRDEQAVRAAIAGQDVIYHCAAQTSHPLSLKMPLLDAEINCLGTLKVLEAVRELQPQAVMVYVSTSTVVGKALSPIIDENHLERPMEIYSANKGVAERYFRIYHTVHGLKTVVLRFANLFGPFGKGYPEFSFVNYFVHLAQAKKPIRIYGTGAQLRNVLSAEDACSALMIAASKPECWDGQPLFVTADEHLSVRQIAEAIVETFPGGGVVFEEWPEERKKIEVDAVRFSSSKFRQMTGWQPKISFTAGLNLIQRTGLQGT